MTALEGRWCLITGATGGLGRHLADAFWVAGANLLLSGRRREALDALAEALPRRAGQRVATVPVDLVEADAPQTLVAAGRAICPRLDVLVNNAATQGAIGPACETALEAWSATVRVNLIAPAALCSLAVDWMRSPSRRAKIINMSGGGATAPRPNFSAYAASKAALVRFTETLAMEVAPHGVDVNAVAPGRLVTAMTGEVIAAGPARAGRDEYEAAVAARVPDDANLQRVVRLCVLLASSASDGITGRLISAMWDPWDSLPDRVSELAATDIYTLRRIVPADRGFDWV